MEEIDRESMKHVCKFCNKSFPCGRSLGGHMRSHVISSTDHHHHLHQSGNRNCSSVLDKLCKECGKGFQSWKALFGHMKCHSIKVLNSKNNNFSDVNQDSWISYSDNENSDAKKRSRSRLRNRGNKRYIIDSNATEITTVSSSVSLNANSNQISSNNASTSMVSEIEQEQEADVAISLMMLSRDLGKWGNEVESTNNHYNSSVLVSLSKVEGKDLIGNSSKMKKLAETQVGFDFFGRSEIKHDELDSNFGEFEDSSKRKFECFTCNKSFHSYQALGGHKASHRKLKGVFDSKIQIENKPMLDHDQTIKGYDPKTSNDHQELSIFNLGVGCLKKKKVVLGAHECPICFKMFSSGQALGGHKRSHLVYEAKINRENINVIKKPNDHFCETRRFLDLNMVPEDEEEEEEIVMSSSTTEYKSYYWENGSDHHNHGPALLEMVNRII